MPERSALRSLTLVAPALLLAGHAAASPIVVLNDGVYKDVIVSHLDYYIPVIQPALELVPYGDLVISPNSITMNFGYLGGVLGGGIGGNTLPQFPGIPLRTPSIFVAGGLRLDGMTLGPSSNDFLRPGYDPILGDSSPAFITHGAFAGADFNLTSFANGDMAYIGYATSDLSIFGYMQIERVTEVDWKLIGYAYDPSGGGILVTNLVPAPSALTLALLAALPCRRTRRPTRSPLP